MADLIPNDLSHMSDEDFNALCPQGEHAPGPEPLSPAAQTVMAAATMGNPNVINDPVYKQCIAAALQAASHQLTSTKAIDTLLAIAAELEARHELDDREDYYWYPESVLLRHKVADALAVPDSTVLEQL